VWGGVTRSPVPNVADKGSIPSIVCVASVGAQEASPSVEAAALHARNVLAADVRQSFKPAMVAGVRAGTSPDSSQIGDARAVIDDGEQHQDGRTLPIRVDPGWRLQGRN
jgi:hypothetical protein